MSNDEGFDAIEREECRIETHDLKIAISGKSGCGNTTVSTMVADYFGLRLINYTFKNLARERGISFEALCKLAEDDPSYDRYVDKRQVELAREGRCVLGSRLAIWLLDEADLKVFLTGSIEERACRIAKREGKDYETTLNHTRERDRRDHERYLRLYGIDNDEYEFADLVIDTSKLDQQQVTKRIIDTIRQ